MRLATNHRITFAALLILAGHASADDAVVGFGAGSCSEAALDIALGQLYPGATFPGGVLSFNCGPTPVTIPISTRKTLTGATVVDGAGRITLDGQNGSAHFAIVGAESRVEIRGLDLFRGHASNSFGGAINVGSGTSLLLADTQIRASSATLSGGAIHVESNAAVHVERVDFVENSAANGGAIASNSTLVILDSSFSGNEANGGEGGAIQQWFATLELADVSFGGNAARHGGALLIRGRGHGGTTADRVIFDGNTAFENGGGIALYDNGVIEGSDLRFIDNRAVDGAGLHLGGTATGNTQLAYGSGAGLVNAVFDGNKASGLGGAAYVFGVLPPMGGQFSVLHLSDSRISRNLAAEGGGIWSKGQMRLVDCLFDDNGALRGGAMTLAPTFVLGEEVLLGYAEITRTDFSDNLATQFGGAIYAVDALPFFNQVNFLRNAANIGGAIMARRFIAPMTNISFVDNFANTGGGALYLQDTGSIQFLNLSFSGNSVFEVGGYGADIVAESTGNSGTSPTQLVMSHSTLLGGHADTGSALYTGGPNTSITLRNSVVLGATEPSCVANAPILSAGGNFTAPSCLPVQPSDVAVSAPAQLGLSALSNAAGRVLVFVPQPGSALIDHADCPSGRTFDARDHDAPVDGDGDSVSRCDSGAVERQPDEPEAVFALFRDGFE